MELINSVLNTLGNIAPKKKVGNEGDWKNFRSFYFSGNGKVKLDIKASSKFGVNNFLEGSLQDFDLNIRDLKVYKGAGTQMQEMVSEEKTYNKKLMELRDLFNKLPFG
jgi:hypothetical protein